MATGSIDRAFRRGIAAPAKSTAGLAHISALPAIVISGLEKRYIAQDGGTIPALGPIDLAIAKHEFVSVIGPSGCGKSTLLKIVAGLVTRSAGRVEILGAESHGPRSDIGIVFQNPVLLPWKTVLDNVLLPLRIRDRVTAEATERSVELLHLIGLGDFIRRYPHELSGGMQQRASLARALTGNPDILLMDEPFGALDAITRDQMQIELLSVWSRSPKTVLFVTHGIAEAVYLSDRVVVLGNRPGRTIQEFAIGLPRPRRIEQMALAAFGQFVTDIRLALDRGIAALTPTGATQRVEGRA